MNTIDVVTAIARHGKGAQFVSFLYRTKKTDELARFTVVLGVNLETLYKRDVEVLEVMASSLISFDLNHQRAILTLLESRRESLEKGIGHNSCYTQEGIWTETGIGGIRYREDIGTIQICGKVIPNSKHVIEAGVHPISANSSPLTLAKRHVRMILPSWTWRSFCLTNIRRIAANGMVLILDTEQSNLELV